MASPVNRAVERNLPAPLGGGGGRSAPFSASGGGDGGMAAPPSEGRPPLPVLLVLPRGSSLNERMSREEFLRRVVPRGESAGGAASPREADER